MITLAAYILSIISAYNMLVTVMQVLQTLSVFTNLHQEEQPALCQSRKTN